MTEQPIIDMLKEELERCKKSIIVKRKEYLTAKQDLKQKESELKQAKKVFYKKYKSWREAREETLRAKRKLSSYPYRVRKWGKDNFGKVWSFLEKEKRK